LEHSDDLEIEMDLSWGTYDYKNDWNEMVMKPIENDNWNQLKMIEKIVSFTFIRTYEVV
jgi:hypothetical protein